MCPKTLFNNHNFQERTKKLQKNLQNHQKKKRSSFDEDKTLSSIYRGIFTGVIKVYESFRIIFSFSQ